MQETPKLAPLAFLLAGLLALSGCGTAPTGLTPTPGPTPSFEIIERGTTDPAVVEAARQATVYSLNSLAGIGAALTALVKIYFAATREDCVAVHVELGWSRPVGERRCDLFSGMTFPGAFIVNMEYIRSRQRDPTGFMWWLIPHELFHLYQWQTNSRSGLPLAFREASAEMHKFKVLHERQTIDLDRYVRTVLVPRAKEARARWNFSILTDPVLDQNNIAGFYSLAGVLGYYLYLNGGWPKMVALNSSPAFREQLQSLYGKTPEAFERDFFTWLDAQ